MVQAENQFGGTLAVIERSYRTGAIDAFGEREVFTHWGVFNRRFFFVCLISLAFIWTSFRSFFLDLFLLVLHFLGYYLNHFAKIRVGIFFFLGQYKNIKRTQRKVSRAWNSAANNFHILSAGPSRALTSPNKWPPHFPCLIFPETFYFPNQTDDK